MRFIGRLSYSIYLWQQLFFTMEDNGKTPLGKLNFFPWNYLATIALALLSFYFVEKPLIRVGRKLVPPSTPGR
jgi:peptidoglycan/LPS O-acetylase OafA/YrhL